MTTHGPYFPSVVESIPTEDAPGGGEAWTDADDVLGDDDCKAKVSLNFDPGPFSRTLKLTGFVFAVPAGKAVLGVKVEVEAGANGDVAFRFVRLVSGGNPVGQNKGDFDPPVNQQLSYHAFGGQAVTWSAGLDAAKVNAVNFGLILAFVSMTSGEVRVSRVRVTVFCAD